MYQNHWSKITDSLQGRTSNMIKNKFYSIFRKVKSKMHRNDFKYNSKLELLEMHYMSSITERYLAHPTPCIKQKGKRGKDFIFSLISNVSQYAVQDYKRNLIEKAKSAGTIDELFEELKKEYKSTLSESLVKSVTKPANTEIRPSAKKKFKLNSEPPSKLPKIPPLPSSNYFARMKQDVKPLNSNCISQQWETSSVFDYNAKSPQFIFSPSSFSSGTNATMAGAVKSAACFRSPALPADGFTELSNNVKNLQLPLPNPLPANRSPQSVPTNMEALYQMPQQMMYLPQQLNDQNYSFSALPANFPSFQLMCQSPFFNLNSPNIQQPF